MGQYTSLIVERHGPVGWLLNNRPEQLNAMTAQMREEFADAWNELDGDPDVRVIVHTGEGRAFQTGVDVTEIATDGLGFERYRRSVEDNDFHFTAWHQKVSKPVITAVNGICAGGGFHWIADADIVIAASDAQFFDPHVSVGQVVAMEAIGLLRKMPAEAVMRMAFVGRYERMSAQRAYELGMVNRVVPREELAGTTFALAEQITTMPPFGLALAKRAVNQCEDLMGMRAGMDSVFGLHHLAHAHNAETAGDSLAGLDAHGMRLSPGGTTPRNPPQGASG